MRWIEAVTACPFFSSLVTYYVEGKGKERHHLAGEELGRLERAYAARGNIYSYILPWESILRAAAKVTSVDVFKSWPHPPHVVAHMIRFIFKGTDEEQCLSFLKELRIRSHVLVGLGRIYAEHLHEMFTGSPVAARLLNRAQNFANYEAGVRQHYPDDKFGGEEGGLCDEIKEAVLNLLRSNQGKDMLEKQKIFKEESSGKNATPEYPKVFSDEKIFEGVRPSILQEDSTAQGVDQELQITSAAANFSEYHAKLQGNILHETFAPRYMSLILPWTYNYMSGGPEYAKFYEDNPETRWRRHSEAAVLNPERFCKHIARRAEMQFSGDWTALPIARNLAVRYQALRKAYMLVGRRQANGKPLVETATKFIDAAKHIFERLDRGTALIHGKSTGKW